MGISMKTALVLFTIALVAIVAAGCSDQTSVIEPSSSLPALTKAIQPDETLESVISVDRIVYEPLTGSLYHIVGTISSSYVVGFTSYSFATSTQLAVNDLNPEKAGYAVDNKMEHVGGIIKDAKGRVTEDYVLDGNTGLTLRLEFVLDESANLEDFFLFVDQIQGIETAK
jgi:hypothetical protein